MLKNFFRHVSVKINHVYSIEFMNQVLEAVVMNWQFVEFYIFRRFSLFFFHTEQWGF